MLTETKPRSIERSGKVEKMPVFLEKLFWQYDFGKLRWPTHRDIIIRQVLTEGDRIAIDWLRERLSDDDLRNWITSRRARQLSLRDIRFWQFMLDIPEPMIKEWLADPARQVWDNRDTAT